MGLPDKSLKQFVSLYSHLGKPIKHIRLMLGLSILKYLENLSDEVLVQRRAQNPYYQAFCGEVAFQWPLPCNSGCRTNVRKSIGVAGHEEILAVSIHVHAEKLDQEGEVCTRASIVTTRDSSVIKQIALK